MTEPRKEDMNLGRILRIMGDGGSRAFRLGKEDMVRIALQDRKLFVGIYRRNLADEIGRVWITEGLPDHPGIPLNQRDMQLSDSPPNLGPLEGSGVPVWFSISPPPPANDEVRLRINIEKQLQQNPAENVQPPEQTPRKWGKYIKGGMDTESDGPEIGGR